MAKKIIRTGTTADPTGDSLKNAFIKVNDNFTELYNALGLDADLLNLGAFEFTGSVMTTTDSSAIVIDQATTVTSNLSVGGDIVPQTANGGDLGSSTLPWRSLYVSNNTIYIGGVAIGLDVSNNLTVSGSRVGTTSYNDLTGKPTLTTVATTGAYADLTGKPTIPTLVSQLANDSGFLTSVGNISNIQSEGNINIEVNLSDSTKRIWQFGEDGDLILPAGGDIKNSTGTSVLGGSVSSLVNGAYTASLGNTGALTLPAGGVISEGGGLSGAIKLTPAGGANANQALLIYPTADAEGDHIHLTAGGGSTELYLGDDFHFVKLTSDGSVIIKADDGVNGAVWGFSPDGTTSIPGDIKSDSNINIEINLTDSTLRRWQFGEDGDTVFPNNVSINYSGNNIQFPRIIADSGKAFSVQGQGTSGSAALSWTVNPDAAGQYAAVAVSKAGGDNLAKVILQAQSDSGDAGTAKIWKFDETGKITLPNGSVIKDTDYVAVAFGLGAGTISQGFYAVAVGSGAGYNGQGNAAVAIGSDAGGTSQGLNAVAVGAGAGYTGQGINAVAIGIQAGYTNQGANSIILNATGATLNQTTANTFTVKPVRQDETADAMYYNSSTGEITYAEAFSFSVAGDDSTQRLISSGELIKFIGAGGITTASDAEGNITINYVQGDIRSEGNINIDINLADSTLRRWHFGEDGELTVPGPISGLGNAKLDFTTYANVAYLTSTSNDATALYMGLVSAELYAQTNILIRTNTDGASKQWTFGDDGSLTLPGEITLTNGAVIKDTDGDAVAFGQSAGATSQGTGAVAVGNTAGQTTQGAYSVAIGVNAGFNLQGSEAVAIGVGAGVYSQGGEAVAIGTNAGYDLQGINAVAIGRSAGGNSQGTNAIAIGKMAGQTNQAANSIILNATGATLDQTTANTFTVAPIRNISATSGVLQYNATTKEVSYNLNVTAESFNTDQITVVGNRISTTVTNANLEIECNGSGGVVINTLAEATTASTARSAGYLGIPASAVSTTNTLTIADAGEHIYVTTNGQTITIPANASVAYPIGTTLTFIAGPSPVVTVSIAITSDTLRLAGGTSTGTRTLAANGMATAVKVAATTWYINGTGLT